MSVKKKHGGVYGQRLFLRSPSLADREEFIALNRDSRIFHRGLVSPATDGAEFADYLTRCHRLDSASFMICRREDEAIVGAINLSQIFLGGFQSAYLGYFIG